MDEVDELAKEVIILKQGQGNGSLESSLSSFGTFKSEGNSIIFTLEDPKNTKKIIQKLKNLKKDDKISNVRPISPSLSDLFATNNDFETTNHQELYSKIKKITSKPLTSPFSKFLRSVQKCLILAIREIKILALQLVIPCAMVIATVNQLGTTTDRLDQPKIFFSDVLEELSMNPAQIMQNKTKLLFPGEHYHGAPAALFWQQKKVFEEIMNNTFSIAHAPFHVHPTNNPVAKGPGLYFAGVTLVYNCIIGLMMTVAPFGMNAVSERVSGFKFMQELVGLPRKIFCAGHYFITIAKFGILLFLTMLLTSFFTDSHEDLEMLSENFGALMMLLFGFILAHTPISFIIGRFSSDSAKYVGDHCNFNVLVTMFTFLTVLTIRLFDDKNLSNNLNHLFMLIPSHNFAMGLFDLYVNENLRRFCVGDFPEYGPRQVCEAGLVDIAEDIWSFEYLAVGKYVAMQFLLIPIYFGILAFLEWPKKVEMKEEKEDSNSLKIEKLRKGDILKDASMEIKKGNTMCLLGPNGAGKTTLVKILCGLKDFDSGSISVSGRSLTPKNIAVCPQFDSLIDKLTANETLAILCYSRGIYELEVIDYALDLLGIGKFKDYQTKNLSGGTKRKLSVACTLFNDPDVFILDEPTCGLDPSSRVQMKKIYEVLQNDNKIVLVATHTIEECMALRAGVTFLSKGEVKFQSSDVSSSLAQFDQKISIVGKSNSLPNEIKDICLFQRQIKMTKKDSRFILESPSNLSLELWELLDDLQGKQEIEHYEFSSPDLQKLFLNVL